MFIQKCKDDLVTILAKNLTSAWPFESYCDLSPNTFIHHLLANETKLGA